MATPVIMPRQGQSVESCIISKWHKRKGDKVETGDILFSYETDKASFDEEAKVSGVLLDVFFKEGDDVPCLMNVCVIGNEGESTVEYNPNSVKSRETESGTEIRETPQDNTDNKESGEAESGPAGRFEDEKSVKISPRARKLSEKAGVDYRYANPSGPGGRIIERDIKALIEAGPVFTAPAKEEHLKDEDGKASEGTGLGGRITTGDIYVRKEKAAAGQTDGTADVQTEGTAADGLAEPAYEEVRIPNIRKVIARAMLHSLSSTAQLTLNASFDASGILEFRRKVKENRERLGFENITINDIIIFAVSRTLPNHRDLNAHFLDDRMLYFKNVNIGVAVDTPRGLMVPTIFNADLKKLNDISAEVKKLARECQSGTINPDKLKNASFTITNLGSLDIESFTPVLNPPQTGILGVNAIVPRAREIDGRYEFYPAMGLSLTFDHRALDGAPAARFLKELKYNLENFTTLLAR